jgi:hypothetical protein
MISIQRPGNPRYQPTHTRSTEKAAEWPWKGAKIGAFLDAELRTWYNIFKPILIARKVPCKVNYCFSKFVDQACTLLKRDTCSRLLTVYFELMSNYALLAEDAITNIPLWYPWRCEEKMKLLVFLIKYHAIKTYGEVQLHVCIGGGVWSVSGSDRFFPVKWARNALVRSLNGTHGWSGRGGGEKKLSMLGIEPRLSSP